MTQEHPITPPEELVREWLNTWDKAKVKHVTEYDFIATQAARWGADQELEACCKWLVKNDWKAVHQHLRAARRPKPLSLKEKALLQLDTLNADLGMHGLGCDLSQIRRALESLPD
jgi:hypothetical protein